MAEPQIDGESPSGKTARLIDFARQILEASIKSKRGNKKAWGKFSVTLEWRGGELIEVNPQDSPTYR
jgi:hypothetical protein